MPQFKIAAVLALAIILQLTLGEAWPRLSHIDFPLIVVVYAALQRDAWTALIVGTIAGLAIDAPSGGLIGAGGFSKTLTAYLVYLGATRINLENALIRIPVLAAATLDGLLSDSAMAARAADVAVRVRAEDGAMTAARALLDQLWVRPETAK